MENQQATAMIILDLSATFNTVDHELLLQVLNHKFGVTGVALDWYKYYLIPRKFKVSINGTYSNEKTMNFSVPQGSVQGAFLFIAYATTIQDVVEKDLTLTGFAGHHSIYKQFKPGTRQEQVTIANLESSLIDIKAWMDAVRLKLNESKTEFIFFGSRKQLSKCSKNFQQKQQNNAKCTKPSIQSNIRKTKIRQHHRMAQDLALVTNKIQNRLQSMHPSIQVLACHGTNLSHQVNQTKTAVQTRTKVNIHEQHPSGT